MTSTNITEILTSLTSAVSELNSTISTHGAKADLHSDHTFYGLNEAIIDDVERAISLIVVATDKIKTITVN